MAGERKKRKMVGYEEEEEEDDEEKIEKFFALIESTRQVRNLLRGSSVGPGEKKDQNYKKADDQERATRGGGAWHPAFQPEDFLDQNDMSTSSAGRGAGPSIIVEEEKKQGKGEGDGLDLNLKLSL